MAAATTPPNHHWIARCGGRLLEVGASADHDGSTRIAGNLWQIERWRALDPVSAADAWSAEVDSLQARLATFGVSAWGDL